MFKNWKTIRLAAVLGLGAVSAPVFAGTSLGEDLARVHVEAAGGKRAIDALRGLRATGVTRIAGQELSFIFYAARPRNLRIETLGETGTLIRVFDGVHAPWIKRDLVARPSRMSPAAEADFTAEADFDNPLYDLKARGIQLDEAGTAEVNGRPCLRLFATVRLTDAFTLYLDEETMMLVRRDQRRRQQGRTVVVETYYEDFRAVAGVKLPFRVRVQIAGRVISDTTINEMVANPGVPPDFFAPPVAGWPRW